MNEYSEEQVKKIKETVLKSLENGATMTKACIAAGTNKVTIWRWRKEDQEFDDAILSILDSRVQVVEDALFVNATSNTKAGDTTAQIFLLKNRSKGRWKDKQEIEHSGKLELNEEETNKLIELAERAIRELRNDNQNNKEDG